MRSIHDEELDIFNTPARVLVAGYSGSGKSYFVSRLIRKYREKFGRVIVVGSDVENCQDLNITRNDNFNPLIDDDEDDDISDNSNKAILVVYDDVIYNKKILETAAEVFIRGRHKNISSIFITQNLFLNNNHYRQIALNVSHIVLLRTRNLSQISCFSKSFLTNSQVSDFVKVYRRHVMREKFKYLMIDFTKDVESPLAIRKNILGEEKYESAILI